MHACCEDKAWLCVQGVCRWVSVCPLPYLPPFPPAGMVGEVSPLPNLRHKTQIAVSVIQAESTDSGWAHFILNSLLPVLLIMAVTVTAPIKGRLHSQTVSLNPHSKPFSTPYSAHFTDKETKAQRDCVTGPSLHRARGNTGSRDPADGKGPFLGMLFGDGVLLTWTPGWAMKCWSVASTASSKQLLPPQASQE